jgi:hypothetical protein
MKAMPNQFPGCGPSMFNLTDVPSDWNCNVWISNLQMVKSKLLETFLAITNSQSNICFYSLCNSHRRLGKQQLLEQTHETQNAFEVEEHFSNKSIASSHTVCALENTENDFSDTGSMT